MKHLIQLFKKTRIFICFLCFYGGFFILLFPAFAGPKNSYQNVELPEALQKTVASIEAFSVQLTGLNQLLNKVHFEAAKNTMSSRFAIFNFKENRIVLNAALSTQIPSQRLLVVAHELGHAFVYLKMSPAELYLWSERFGPWGVRSSNVLRENEQSFEDRAMHEPHPFSQAPNQVFGDLPNTPTRYALSSRHEWIAECFASWLTNQISAASNIKIANPIDLELQNAFADRLQNSMPR